MYDRRALPEESHAIGERIGHDARVLVVRGAGAGHTNLFGANPDAVRGEIDGFLEKVRKTPGAAGR